MKRFLSFLVLMLMLFGCGRDKEERPSSGTVSKKKSSAPSLKVVKNMETADKKFLDIVSLRNQDGEFGAAEGEHVSTQPTQTQNFATAELTKQEFSEFPFDAMETLVREARAPEETVETTDELEALLDEEADRMEDLETDFENMPDLKPLSDLRAKIASRYYGIGNTVRAVEYLLNSLTLDPENAERWEQLGDWASTHEEPETIGFLQHAYGMALRYEPDRRSAQVKLAGVCTSAGNFEAAKGLLETVLDDGDVHPEWLHIGLLASMYARTNDLYNGISFFEQMLLKHGYNQYMLALAILEHENGDRQAATEYLDYVEKKVDDPLLRQYAGLLRTSFEEAK